MDVTLEINGVDFSGKLSTYKVDKEVSYHEVVTTLDGSEHYGKTRKRDVIYFTMLPLDDELSNKYYSALSSSSLSVSYTDPNSYASSKIDKLMVLASNISSAFGLRSVNGKRYYKGGEIILRSPNVE